MSPADASAHSPGSAPVHPGPEDGRDDAAGAGTDGPAHATRGDRILLAFFWVWAGLLALAALSHLFGWDGVLDALDVKRWFSR